MKWDEGKLLVRRTLGMETRNVAQNDVATPWKLFVILIEDLLWKR